MLPAELRAHENGVPDGSRRKDARDVRLIEDVLTIRCVVVSRKADESLSAFTAPGKMFW